MDAENCAESATMLIPHTMPIATSHAGSPLNAKPIVAAQVPLTAERRSEAGLEALDYIFTVTAIVPAAMDGRETAYLPFAVLDEIMKADVIPVLAPVAGSRDGGTFNVNV